MKSPPVMRVTVGDENIAVTSPPALNVSMSPPSAPLPGTPSASPSSPSQTPPPVSLRPAVRMSRMELTSRKTKRKTVVSTLARKSPVKRKPSPDSPKSPATPIGRRLRPRK